MIIYLHCGSDISMPHNVLKHFNITSCLCPSLAAHVCLRMYGEISGNCICLSPFIAIYLPQFCCLFFISSSSINFNIRTSSYLLNFYYISNITSKPQCIQKEEHPTRHSPYFSHSIINCNMLYMLFDITFNTLN